MDDGSGRLGLVALLGRLLRARIRSHPQIWIVATVGYVACTADFWKRKRERKKKKKKKKKSVDKGEVVRVRA